LPFIGNTVNNYVDRWTFENYTLLGDPTCPIWTGDPKEMVVNTTPSLDLGPQTVSVTVEYPGGGAVVGATVCIAKGDEDYECGTTDASGQVDLEFLPLSGGEAVVTVTGVNLALTTTTIPVTTGNAYMALYSTGIFDDGQSGSSGNGNQMIEAGETIAVFALLQETGGAATSGLSGVLSTSADDVMITTTDVGFTSVSAGGIASPLGAFVIEFGPEIPDATPVTFELQVVDRDGMYSHSEWNIVVKAPEPEVVHVEWDDVTWGNGDGDLDHGERVGVTVRYKNFGAGTANELMARLRAQDANVVLYDTVSTVPDLELQQEGETTSRFSLSLTNMIYNTSSTIVLEDVYGNTWDHTLTLQRPLEPTDLSTDTSLGADVIALSWVPSATDDVYGYNVYRSMNETTDFTKANVDVIAGTSYFRDEGLQQLTRYFYRVETVANSMVPSEESVTIAEATAPAERSGFPIQFGGETSGHLAVGDVDGDGDLEIVMAADEVYVWHHDGQELMDGDLNSQTLGPITNLGTILHPAGVALGHLDSDPGKEIVVTEHNVEFTGVHVFRKDGSEMPGWPQSLAGVGGEIWNWATPAIGDIDGDGEPEIVVNTLNSRVWAWHVDGTEVRDGDGNPATNGVFFVRPGADWEWSLSGPALYDLDGDGGKDIIFGTKWDNSGLKRLMALKSDGTDVPGFPYEAEAGIICDAAIGDLNADGTMEIVFFDVAGNLYAVQADGSDYPGFPVSSSFGGDNSPGTSPALGDVDDDGELEIIWAANANGHRNDLVVYDTDISGGTSGQILAGWPVVLPGNSESSPVVGDIDGDESPDILFGIGGGDTESPNNLYAFHADGDPIDGFPITLGGPIRPAPVICDLDHDTDVDIVYGGWDRLIHVWDMPFAYDRRNVPWPTFQGSVLRDGVFYPLELVGVEDETEIPAAGLTVQPPFPNPFNPSTAVKLYVPADHGGSAELEVGIYNLQGRRVRLLHAGRISAGWHTLVWDGRDDDGRGQSSGLYFLRAKTAEASSTHKMTLIK